MDELFARAFVFHRAAEQSLIEPQGNPHPAVVADQHLEVDGQFGILAPRRAGGGHPLQAESRRLVAPLKLVLQLVKLHEILVLEIENRLEIALFVGQVVDRRPGFLDAHGRLVRRAAAGGLAVSAAAGDLAASGTDAPSAGLRQHSTRPAGGHTPPQKAARVQQNHISCRPCR